MSQRLRQLELIAEGAQAQIFRGQLVGERATYRSVAVKRLREELRDNPQAVELFVHEARIALQVDHPNLARAIELSRDDEGYYLVCEWVDGLPLNEVHNRAGPAPWQALVYLGQAVCEGLEHLHRLASPEGTPLGAVHRDVTPANILVGADGLVKLGDFGVVSCNSGDLLDAAGTPGFAAPEQEARAEIAPTADVYGLGQTLRSVAAELPAPLEAVLERAAATSPADRYDSAADFSAALATAAQEAKGAASLQALRAWAQKAGASHSSQKRPARLDKAVRSVLQGALEPSPASAAPLSASAPGRAARTPRRTAVVGGLALVAVAAAGGAVALRSEAEPKAIRSNVDQRRHVERTSIPTPRRPMATQGREGPQSGDHAQAKAPARSNAAGSATELSVKTGDRDSAAKESENKPSVSPTRAQARTTKPKPARTAEPELPGTLHINALPWAEVWIDGQRVGSTPLRAIELPAGERRLELHHPPEGLRRTILLNVKPAAVQTVVIDLRRGRVEKRAE